MVCVDWRTLTKLYHRPPPSFSLRALGMSRTCQRPPPSNLTASLEPTLWLSIFSALCWLNVAHVLVEVDKLGPLRLKSGPRSSCSAQWLGVLCASLRCFGVRTCRRANDQVLKDHKIHGNNVCTTVVSSNFEWYPTNVYTGKEKLWLETIQGLSTEIGSRNTADAAMTLSFVCNMITDMRTIAG